MTDPLMKAADCKPTSVTSTCSVREAVRTMAQAGVGAVAVIDDNELVGIFTERDLMMKVVDAGKDPDGTPVSEAMERAPMSVDSSTGRDEAIKLMVENQFRHLPVTRQGDVVAMLSMRVLMHHQLERLRDDVSSLEAYICADGPGG